MKKMPVTVSSLIAIGLLKNLDADLRSTLSQKCSGFTYARNEVIKTQDGQTSFVCFILSGRVHVVHLCKNGREISFGDHHAGEMLGLTSAIDGRPQKTFARAIEVVNIASIERSRFLSLLYDHAILMYRVLSELTSINRALTDRLMEYSELSVNQRIDAELLRLAENEGQRNETAVISHVPTHANLASRVATHREAVTRELKCLRDCGLIKKIDRKLIITRVSELRARAIG